MSKISDSILTDILEGIRSSHLILGDITAIGVIDHKPVYNGNVLYEIGIAQAIRLPEEVVLFSSDDYNEYNRDTEDKKILFDLSHIRVNSYDPDGDTEKASNVLEEILVKCLSK